MKNRLLLILLLAVAQYAAAQPPDTALSLTEVIRQAVNNNPAVAAGVAQVQAAQARVGEARSYWYPDLGTRANYSYVAPVPKASFPGFGTLRFAPNNNFNTDLYASYTLYDFGRRQQSVELARAQALGAAYSVELTKTNLSYQAAQLYYSILYLQQNLVVLDSQLAELGVNLRNAEARVAAQTATGYDVLTVETRISAIRSARVEVESQLETQRAQMRSLMGVRPDFPLRLQETLSDSAFQVPDSLRRPNTRIELQQAQINRQAAEIQVSQSRSVGLPALTTQATAGFKNGYIPNIYALRANYMLGLGLNVPLFAGFRSRYHQEAASANLRSVLAQNQVLERQISTEIEQAEIQFTAAALKLDYSETEVRQAQAAVVRARARYAEGISAAYELLDAEQNLLNANLKVTQARLELLSGYYALRRAVGDRLYDDQP